MLCKIFDFCNIYMVLYARGDYMILSELTKHLLARRITISELSRGTGISRPTLTALANNTTTGIQYDTLNKICSYLEIDPSLLLIFIPFELSITLNKDLTQFTIKITDTDVMQNIKGTDEILNIELTADIEKIEDETTQKEAKPLYLVTLNAKSSIKYQRVLDKYLEDYKIFPLTEYIGAICIKHLENHTDDFYLHLENFGKLDKWDVLDLVISMK